MYASLLLASCLSAIFAIPINDTKQCLIDMQKKIQEVHARYARFGPVNQTELMSTVMSEFDFSKCRKVNFHFITNKPTASPRNYRKRLNKVAFIPRNLNQNENSNQGFQQRYKHESETPNYLDNHATENGNNNFNAMKKNDQRNSQDIEQHKGETYSDTIYKDRKILDKRDDFYEDDPSIIDKDVEHTETLYNRHIDNVKQIKRDKPEDRPDDLKEETLKQSDIIATKSYYDKTKDEYVKEDDFKHSKSHRDFIKSDKYNKHDTDKDDTNPKNDSNYDKITEREPSSDDSNSNKKNEYDVKCDPNKLDELRNSDSKYDDLYVDSLDSKYQKDNNNYDASYTDHKSYDKLNKDDTKPVPLNENHFKSAEPYESDTNPNDDEVEELNQDNAYNENASKGNSNPSKSSESFDDFDDDENRDDYSETKSYNISPHTLAKNDHNEPYKSNENEDKTDALSDSFNSDDVKHEKHENSGQTVVLHDTSIIYHFKNKDETDNTKADGTFTDTNTKHEAQTNTEDEKEDTKLSKDSIITKPYKSNETENKTDALSDSINSDDVKHENSGQTFISHDGSSIHHAINKDEAETDNIKADDAFTDANKKHKTQTNTEDDKEDTNLSKVSIIKHDIKKDQADVGHTNTNVTSSEANEHLKKQYSIEDNKNYIKLNEAVIGTTTSYKYSTEIMKDGADTDHINANDDNNEANKNFEQPNTEDKKEVTILNEDNVQTETAYKDSTTKYEINEVEADSENINTIDARTERNKSTEDNKEDIILSDESTNSDDLKKDNENSDVPDEKILNTNDNSNEDDKGAGKAWIGKVMNMYNIVRSWIEHVTKVVRFFIQHAFKSRSNN